MRKVREGLYFCKVVKGEVVVFGKCEEQRNHKSSQGFRPAQQGGERDCQKKWKDMRREEGLDGNIMSLVMTIPFPVVMGLPRRNVR